MALSRQESVEAAQVKGSWDRGIEGSRHTHPRATLTLEAQRASVDKSRLEPCVQGCRQREGDDAGGGDHVGWPSVLLAHPLVLCMAAPVRVSA